MQKDLVYIREIARQRRHQTSKVQQTQAFWKKRRGENRQWNISNDWNQVKKNCRLENTMHSTNTQDTQRSEQTQVDCNFWMGSLLLTDNLSLRARRYEKPTTGICNGKNWFRINWESRNPASRKEYQRDGGRVYGNADEMKQTTHVCKDKKRSRENQLYKIWHHHRHHWPHRQTTESTRG